MGRRHVHGQEDLRCPGVPHLNTIIKGLFSAKIIRGQFSAERRALTLTDLNTTPHRFCDETSIRS